jgi:hypothetical protein
MNEPVKDSARLIKTVEYLVQRAAVAVFIPAPDGIGNKVSDLKSSRKSGRREQRHVDDIAQWSPKSGTNSSKVPREAFEALPEAGIIEDEERTILVALIGPALQVGLDAHTKLLETALNRVFVPSGLVDCYGEENDSRIMSVSYNPVDFAYDV